MLWVVFFFCAFQIYKNELSKMLYLNEWIYKKPRELKELYEILNNIM